MGPPVGGGVLCAFIVRTKKEVSGNFHCSACRRRGSQKTHRQTIRRSDRCAAATTNEKTYLEEVPMKKRPKHLATSVALAIGVTLAASSTFAQSVDTARIEGGGQNDWLTY